MTITREGNFTRSPVNVLEEINIFEGHQNRITFQQVYSKTFKCVYQLQLYPFDTQVGKNWPFCYVIKENIVGAILYVDHCSKDPFLALHSRSGNQRT